MTRRTPRDGKGRRIVLAVLRWSTAVLSTFALAAIAGFAAAVGVYSGDLPSTGDLRENYRPEQVNRYYAADGSLIGETYTERRSVAPMSKIPGILIKAVLAAEDADFFEHKGLDYPGILRALWINVRARRKAQGASTITQQVVRTFYLGREKTFSRKFKELLLARRLEQNLSKEEILFLYLNQIYFGHGRYGIQEASRLYFGKDVEDVSLGEAALLAGLPKGPELYTPLRNPEKAARRRSWVLGEMVRHGYVTEAEAAVARLAPVPTEPSSSLDRSLGAEFVDSARRILFDAVGEQEATRGGYHVYTTMDPGAQSAARQAVEKGLMKLDARRGYRGPIKPRGKKGKKACREWPPGVSLPDDAAPAAGKVYAAAIEAVDDGKNALLVSVGSHKGVVSLDREGRYNPRGLSASAFAVPGCRVRVGLLAGEGTWGQAKVKRFGLELGPQALLVALEPRTREVVAMVGGQGYVRGDFNRALRAVRQPGSAFKPFVYLEAIRSRTLSAASVQDDAPVSYDEYRPGNYETWKFMGPVRLRKALAKSINVVAVRLIDDVGPDKVAALASSLGITSKLDPVLGLALGGSGVRPIGLANAYATIAAGGIRSEPVIVRKVVDPFGRQVELDEPEPSVRVIGQDEAWILTSMLRSVIEDPEGTGKSARKLGRPAAGKTGTSNKARDAWFAGFTPDLAAVVWVGFDDYKSLGKKESGGRSAVPVWTSFMKSALDGSAEKDFAPPPAGVTSALVDPATGLLAWEGQPDAFLEYFLEGTEPMERAFPPGLMTPEGFLMQEGFEEELPAPDAAPVAVDAPVEVPPADAGSSG
ncbi:MAG: PBP1A family penicillin-binding protein [Deltaproteobacteria bacterium]|nr:PBP1A family penicillin-binding protein [Deltaproteobacteria bacterium]